MGLTPLEGLVMGTRSGDVDPNLQEFLAGRLDVDLAGVTNILNRESGLLGLSGLSNDMRALWRRSTMEMTAPKLPLRCFATGWLRQSWLSAQLSTALMLWSSQVGSAKTPLLFELER